MANYQLNTGKLFEDDLLVVAKQFFASKNDEGSFVETTGTELDKYEGTDALIWGVPVDFTYNFDNKDNMIELQRSIILSLGIEVKFGVRVANECHRFKTPVLVIGFKCDTCWLKTMWENIFDDIRRSFEEIIETGQDQYWNCLDAMA